MKPGLASLYVASEWIIRLGMLWYVPQRRATAAARAWLVLIFLVPWFGLGCFLIVGRIRVPEKRRQRQQRAADRVRAVLAAMKTAGGAARPALDARDEPTAVLVERLGGFAPIGGNRVELLVDYEGMVDRLIADIDAARAEVHLLFYIFAADAIGRRVAAAIERAAGRGLSCRVLMDALGSAQGLRKLGPGLRAAGVDVVAAMPVGPLRRNPARADLRNHRKIAVIDRGIGYVGSQNLVGAEFVRGYPNEELMARVMGPVVTQLDALLLADRYEETEQSLTLEDAQTYPEPTGTVTAQVLPSGPLYPHENPQALLCSLFHVASERVVITTPYFVPDEPFLVALETAAVRGAEVHLVVPEHSNKPITLWAQRSHYERLLEAGVRIHLYASRFLHAKHVTVDGRIAVIGSVNIDIRSFALDSEVSLLVYDRAVVQALEAIQARYFAGSRALSRDEWRRRPVLAKIAENTARLADSLL
ncbi:MAG TPA: cardiolipin synthase [Polyangia bacterium]|nr:cardiolipin synthase [Polyangia bacterium]